MVPREKCIHEATQLQPQEVANSDKEAAGKRTWISMAIKGAISIGLVAYIFSRVDMTAIAITFSNLVVILLCGALLALQPPIMSLRWWMILDKLGERTRFWQLNRLNWKTIFANQILPATVGSDLLRVVLGNRLGLLLTRVIASVALDRIFALIALLLLVAVLLPILMRDGINGLPIIIGALLGLGALGLALSGVVAQAIRRWLGHLAVGRTLADLGDHVWLIVRQPSALTMLIGLSLAVHVLSLAALLLIAYSFGVLLEPLTVIAAGAVLTLVHILPISIGGWGAREMAALSIFGSLGLKPEVAVSISIALGLSYAIASLPGLAFWVVDRFHARASAW